MSPSWDQANIRDAEAGCGAPWVGLAWALPVLRVFFSVSPGVSTGSACPSMPFPTAASAKRGTRGPCATRPGLPQSRVGACSACTATARPRPPRGRTVCVTLAFQASSVSKVRGPPPDVPSPGSLPTTGFSNLVFSSSQPQQPLCAPAPSCTLGCYGALVTPPLPPTPCSLGSKSPSHRAPISPWPSFSCSLISGVSAPLAGISPYRRDRGNSSCPDLCIVAPSPWDPGAAEVYGLGTPSQAWSA